MIGMHLETDAQLVLRSRAGDVSAFEALVARHRTALIATAAARLGSLADAEDVAQDALVRTFFRLDDLRDPAALSPWLRRMTDRLALMRLRSRREEPVDPEDLDVLPHAERDPAGQVAQAEDLLAGLPRPMRQALVLTSLAGYTCAETGRLPLRSGPVRHSPWAATARHDR
jgi:RNA polymerase sigma factor (sigma-70 family)